MMTSVNGRNPWGLIRFVFGNDPFSFPDAEREGESIVSFDGGWDLCAEHQDKEKVKSV